jgi:hypothetical protein
LEREVIKIKREKEEEIENRLREKDKFEKIIKELEDRIGMLRNESGD